MSFSSLYWLKSFNKKHEYGLSSGLLIGLLTGMAFGLIGSIVYQLSFGWIAGLALWASIKFEDDRWLSAGFFVGLLAVFFGVLIAIAFIQLLRAI